MNINGEILKQLILPSLTACFFADMWAPGSTYRIFLLVKLCVLPLMELSLRWYFKVVGRARHFAKSILYSGFFPFITLRAIQCRDQLRSFRKSPDRILSPSATRTLEGSCFICKRLYVWRCGPLTVVSDGSPCPFIHLFSKHGLHYVVLSLLLSAWNHLHPRLTSCRGEARNRKSQDPLPYAVPRQSLPVRTTHVRFRRWIEKEAIILQRLFGQMCGQMVDSRLTEASGKLLWITCFVLQAVEIVSVALSEPSVECCQLI